MPLQGLKAELVKRLSKSIESDGGSKRKAENLRGENNEVLKTEEEPQTSSKKIDAVILDIKGTQTFQLNLFQLGGDKFGTSQAPGQ